jgi:hypothetical protein
MVCSSQDRGVYELCLLASILKNTTFWKLGLFLSSGEGMGDICIGSVERVILPSLVVLFFGVPVDG